MRAGGSQRRVSKLSIVNRRSASEHFKRVSQTCGCKILSLCSELEIDVRLFQWMAQVESFTHQLQNSVLQRIKQREYQRACSLTAAASDNEVVVFLVNFRASVTVVCFSMRLTSLIRMTFYICLLVAAMFFGVHEARLPSWCKWVVIAFGGWRLLADFIFTTSASAVSKFGKFSWLHFPKRLYCGHQ